MAELEKLSFLKINGVEAPTPRTWSAVDSTFDSNDSVRDETGYLNRTVIRRNQHAPKFSWRLRGKDLSRLLNMIDSEKLEVSYFDLKTKKMITFTGYPQATRSVKMAGAAWSDNVAVHRCGAPAVGLCTSVQR